MSRKKAARSSGPAKPKNPEDPAGPESWSRAIEAVRINDDRWWCIVIMMTEARAADAEHVSLFERAAERGERRAIYPLSRRKTLANLRSLSKSRAEGGSGIHGVRQRADLSLSETNEEPGGWLMARVIKYTVYRAKLEWIGRAKKRDELEREIDEEYRVMRTVAESGSRAKERTEAGASIGKANTKVRKRGEGWLDAVYLDDAPFGGPNLYVILTGFHDPDLPAELISVGVPLICVLKIKGFEAELKDSSVGGEEFGSARQSRFCERPGERELLEFWERMEKRAEEPRAHWDVAFLAFRPPEIPEGLDDAGCEKLALEVYDQVSRIAYDVYELYRQHAKYLNSMRLEKGLDGPAVGQPDTRVYSGILDAIPQRCVSVPVILCAMLFQVEASLPDPRATSSNGKNGGDGSKLNLEQDPGETEFEITGGTDAALSIGRKLKALRSEHELGEDRPPLGPEEGPADPELVLHGDAVAEVGRFYRPTEEAGVPGISIPRAADLLARVLRILRRPDITRPCTAEPPAPELTLGKYSRHLDGIRRSFGKDRLSNEEATHCLHIAALDKMISDESSPRPRRLDRPSAGVFARTKRRGESVPRPAGKSGLVNRSKSEADIARFGSAIAYADCSPLFDLLDQGELLIPGRLERATFRRSPPEKALLEEYRDVELLSDPVFRQVAHQCLNSFDRHRTRYFEPTDSLLIHFGRECPEDAVRETGPVSSRIRTPVRFREFSEHVVHEEAEWTRREREAHRLRTASLPGRSMSPAPEKYDGPMIFTDEHFILPGSLKGRDLRRNNDPGLDRSSPDTDASSRKPERKRPDVERPREEGGPGRSGMTSPAERRGEEGDASILPPREIPSFRCAEDGEPHEFTGYDLTGRRVEVTHHRRTFLSSDGTLVRVELERWLYKEADLRITVTLGGSSLRLFRRIAARQISAPFHLTTETGIVLAFQRSPRSDQPAGSPADDQRGASFDFRASWPSGLLIEPIPGDAAEDPFYVRQSYAAKNRGTEEADRELSRKFLRNGTVLKYMHDGTVVVLRANGTIVRCTGFGSPPPAFSEKAKRDPTVAANYEKGSKSASRKESTDLRNSRKVSEDQIRSQNGITSMTEVPGGLKVSRYKVLNHDGREYEVLEDRVVSEHHRLLVRTASDYELDEKLARRADGTDMLLGPDGKLIVTFPDGTRITTGYAIEERPVMCDWTEEEFERYFTEEHPDSSSSGSKSHGEDSPGSDTELNGRMTEILIADGFVSVLLTCRVEHKKYATVFYDQSAVSCALSMPDDLRVSISRRGHYEVSMAAAVNLKVTEKGLTFSRKLCDACAGGTSSVYEFAARARTVLRSRDLFGNVFEVKDDGDVRYRQKARRSSNEGTGQTGEEEKQRSCEHRGFDGATGKRRCRVFALNRDLTAHEYLHRSEKREQEAVARSDNETSLILYPISRRPELSCLITFEPVELESRSKAKLQTFQLRRDFDAGRSPLPRKAAGTEEPEGGGAGEADFENDLREFALGIKRNVEVELYRRGLEGKSNGRGGKAGQGSVELIDTPRKKLRSREELERYKRCMRERMVPGYFRSIAGMCFLWLKELVEERCGESIEDDSRVAEEEGG